MTGIDDTEFENWLRGQPDDEGERIAQTGVEIDGWHLVAFIARGGNGEVWRAANVRTGQTGIVKIGLDTSEKSVRRMANAQEFLRQSVSGRFPALYGSGTWSGRSYLILEELEPMELPRRPREIETFILGVAEAVGELHAKGYVHRDIKPQNVMTRDGRRPVLIDFGLLKDTLDSDGNPAKSSVFLVDGKIVAAGTPGYAAPEQLTGGRISPASDVHALGVLADACFQGNPPERWLNIIRRCTSSLPERRFSSVSALCRAIRRLAVWRVVAAVSVTLVLAGLVMGACQWASRVRTRELQAVYVAANAVTEGADGSRRHPYSRLADAIRKATAGAEVRVGPGTYEGGLVLRDRPVKLVSTDGARSTVLRGPSADSVLRLEAGADGSLVRGFTLTGGKGHPNPSSYGFDYYGGGVSSVVSARFEDCLITENGKGVPKKSAATFGGGVFVGEGTVTLVNCQISDNFAWASGGGLMASGANAALVLERCSVRDNASTAFFGNQAGISLSHAGVLSLRHCRVEGNRGDQLGAFGGPYSADTRAEVVSSLIEGGPRACNIVKFIAEQAAPEGAEEALGCRLP